MRTMFGDFYREHDREHDGELKADRYEIIKKSLYIVLEYGDEETVMKVTEQIMSATQSILLK